MSARAKVAPVSTRPSTATRIGRGLRKYLPPLLLMAGILILWELAVSAYAVPKAILPSPSAIGSVLVSKSDRFADNLGVTLIEILLGFLLGLVLGVGSAILIFYSGIFERTVYPIIVISQVVPIFAIAPLLIIWFGFGMTPKIIITAIVVFFPITVNMVVGLRSADAGVINLMRSYKATSWQTFRYVRLPTSLPLLFAGIQTGITYSVIGAVIAEWVGSEKGIGNLMITANSISRTDIVFGSIFLVGVVGIVLFVTSALIGRFLTPWQRLEQ
jgi:ABC-type nitrate/sulfonate/bicarbonate transport system permease component